MKTKRITVLTLIIVVFGLISVYSSSHVWALYKYDDSLYYIKRQAILLVLVSLQCMSHPELIIIFIKSIISQLLADVFF